MCLMLLPCSEGLNGACEPYGFGIGSSPSPSGMYALGRLCAVDNTPPPRSILLVASDIAISCLSLAFSVRTCTSIF